MKAIVLYRSCSPEELKISEVPVPEVKQGWVLIKVKAFGLNRSELIMRAYEADAPYIKLPRIPGIECAGEIADPSDSNLIKGQRIVALMGGMGRSFDGSYAEYTLVPFRNVFRIETKIGWEELAAVPETYFTAWGSLFDSLQLKSEEILLIRGGSSALGLAAIQLAKSINAKVVATTRDKNKCELLTEQGADSVLIDDGSLKDQLLSLYVHGVHKVLELIGPATLKESTGLVRHHGIICSTGVLGGKGFLNNFDPIKDIPSGVYLTGFFSNYPTQVKIYDILEHLNKHKLHPVISKIFSLDEIGQAHSFMENNEANGKVIVRI
ncbi:MAG: zinc-binding dehydrogenase [Bacteroidales bacterium]|nr:zinc-binding dehydrogenase [Bacteroidales bacterium]MBK7628825.1 zinc-binding dehydrogenase [Bacteroidales bacterium]